MMQNKFNNLLNNGLKYGAIMGGALIMLSMIYYITGFQFTSFSFIIINFLVTLALFIAFLFWSNKQAAKLFDSLNYGEALVNALITGVVASIISAAYSYVFNAFFDPDYAKEMMQSVLTTLENNPNMPREEIDKIYEQFDQMTPVKMSLDALKQSLIFMAIMSLIVSAFTRKKEDIFEEESEVIEN